MKTIPTTIRISKDLKSKLEQLAKKDNRSLNNFINNILIQYIEAESKKQNSKSSM